MKAVTRPTANPSRAGANREKRGGFDLVPAIAAHARVDPYASIGAIAPPKPINPGVRTMTIESTEPCRHIALAHGSAGHITICPECKAVQVALRHLTLRFAPDVFREIAHMFGAAQARLDHASAAVIGAAERGVPSLH